MTVTPRAPSVPVAAKELSALRTAVREAVAYVRTRTRLRPRAALILGSGLGDFASHVEPEAVFSSADIPNYPVSSVQGHAGTLVFGVIRDGTRTSVPILVFKGRVHYYETSDIARVILPVAMAAGLGARSLIVTNAAGGLDPRMNPGDLMLLRDIIDLSFVRVPDLRPARAGAHRVRSRGKGVFDDRTSDVLRCAAQDVGIRLLEGTYCWLKGPTYETAAEIQMVRRLGADAVGMSTVPEILTARRLGMRVAGISLISNLATGISTEKLSHAEVTETANRVKETFTALMKEAVLRLS